MRRIRDASTTGGPTTRPGSVRLWLDNEEPSYRYWTEQDGRGLAEDASGRHRRRQFKEELSYASSVNEPTVIGTS